jgi:hypothetical protein
MQLLTAHRPLRKGGRQAERRRGILWSEINKFGADWGSKKVAKLPYRRVFSSKMV